MMLDKEICIRFSPVKLVMSKWFMPVLVIVLFGVIWASVYAPWDSPGAPAWVQAVGSVLAILVAGWAALHSSQSQQRAGQNAEEQRCQIARRALYEIAVRGGACTGLLARWHDDIEGARGGHLVFAIGQLEAEMAKAKEIRLIELPSPELIDILLNLILTMGQAAFVAEALHEEGRSESSREFLDDIQEDFRGFIASLQPEPVREI